MSKYGPLTSFLRGQPSEKKEVALSFAEFEQVLGKALPYTARIDRPWWANTKASNHALKWLEAGWKIARVDLDGERVVFVRLDGSVTYARREQGGYGKLRHFLAGLPAKQEQLALTFDEIGKIMDRPLPKTAFHDEPWWANTKGSQGSAWLAAGWRVTRVYLKARIAVFRRKGTNPLSSIPKYLRDVLDCDSHAGHPDAHTLARWIRFCVRVGWYFEGTMLFERGGLVVDSLSETEQSEVEEDYGFCKRELRRYKTEG